jgi:hypothetical protein
MTEVKDDNLLTNRESAKGPTHWSALCTGGEKWREINYYHAKYNRTGLNGQ